MKIAIQNGFNVLVIPLLMGAGEVFAEANCRDRSQSALLIEQKYIQALKANDLDRLISLKAEKKRALEQWAEDCKKPGGGAATRTDPSATGEQDSSKPTTNSVPAQKPALNADAKRRALQQLGKQLEDADTDARASLLRSATINGLIKEEKGRSPNARAQWPPNEPDFLHNDPGLPKTVRDAIHQHNLGLVKDYEEKYEQYVDRYTKAVKRAKNASELRRLGAPVKAFSLHQPGMYVSHPDYESMRRDWYGDLGTTGGNHFRAYQAVGDRMYDFTGRRKPGTVWVKLAGKVGLQGLGKKVGAESEVKLDSDGKVENKVGADAEVEAGPVTVGRKVGESDSDDSSSIGIDAHLAKVKFDSQGNFEAETEVGKQGIASGAVVGRTNPREATTEAGIKLGLGSRKLPVFAEGEVAAGMYTISADEVKRAIEPFFVGFFPNSESRRMVLNGLTWDKLPKDTRKRLRDLAWNENDWNNQVQ